ncbi:asparagine synthase-related protein [Anianabacter salinae]|uniref:asparagine synthase-related protein n=1 Tax=Anianabacter salinae TaxID=2851023 RepID=UPI00225E4EF3|nr:asparagine synthase-related protein [Anianabacter salinae]MBV0912439.1 hypothetical protein [Anianabacter salinae]
MRFDPIDGPPAFLVLTGALALDAAARGGAAPDLSAPGLAVWLGAKMAARGHVSAAHLPRGEDVVAGVVLGRFFDGGLWPGPGTAAKRLCRHFDPARGVPRTLCGEFAFVHWDSARGSLTLGTDQAGTRCVFYTDTGKGIAAASDIESLRAWCPDPERIDQLALADYLTGSMEHGEHRTLVAGIRRVPAAHCATVRGETITVSRYWDPRDAPQITLGSDGTCIEMGRALLADSMRDRMASPGPFGVHLSGGYDSSVVAGLLAQDCRARGLPPPPAFAWHADPGTEAALHPDTLKIDAVRRATGLDLTFCPGGPASFEAFLAVDPARFPLCLDYEAERPVLDAARGKDIATIFSGWGGDQALSFSGRASPPPSALRRGASHVLRHWLRGQPVTNPYFRPAPPRQTRLATLKDALGRRTTRQVVIDNLTNGFLPRRMTTWCVAGAAAGLQYSYPLCDPRLLDFAMGVPDRLYRAGGTPRQLMRDLIKGTVPPEVLDHPAKVEVSRLDRHGDLVTARSRLIAGHIDSGRIDQARARDLDIDRLRHDLARAEAGDKVPWGKIMNAAAYLLTP